jgi:cobalt/nickel transport system permease protein
MKEVAMVFFSPMPMHIPDGFLSVIVSVVFWVLSVAAIALALRFVPRDLGERDVPVMGVLAAAIFAGQMLNFAVTGGTSGHLLGAALATIVLGPWAAVLVMTAVVATQALIFQDGGLLALGANLFNMAVIGVAVSYGVYQVFRKISRGQKWGVFAGGFAAAWMSIFIASLAAAMQLAASGTSPANLALPAMAGIHALIGIGEGLITVGALSFIYAARRDLLKLEKAQPSGARGVLWVGLAIALLLAALSPLASANPDGLEWVAEQQGFLNQVKAPLFSLIPDYIVPGLSNETLATIAAGVIGVLVVMGVAIGVGAARRKRNITG